jgi:hypothetical protein
MKKSILNTICSKLKEWFFIPESVTKEDILDATKPGEHHYDALDIAINKLARRFDIDSQSKSFAVLFWSITLVGSPATGWAKILSWIFGRIFVIRIVQYMSRHLVGWNILVSINYIYLGIILWTYVIIPIPDFIRQLIRITQ